jgi:hypothetical protein
MDIFKGTYNRNTIKFDIWELTESWLKKLLQVSWAALGGLGWYSTTPLKHPWNSVYSCSLLHGDHFLLGFTSG